MVKEKIQNSFFKDLFDYKLRSYITRRVASVIYLGYLIIIPVGTVMGTYFVFDYARHLYNDRNFHWQLAIIWIVGPLIGLIILIYTRLLVELNIAIVNVAENTEPQDQ